MKLEEEIREKFGPIEWEYFAVYFLPSLDAETRKKIEAMNLDEYERFMLTEEFRRLPLEKKPPI